MLFKSTPARHGAPRAKRRWFTRTRPACGPVPHFHDLPITPGMPERPTEVLFGVPAQWIPRAGDGCEVIDPRSVYYGRFGLVEAFYGVGHPVVVDLAGGAIVYLEVEQLAPTTVQLGDTIQIAAVPADLDDDDLTLMGDVFR